MQAMILAAGMGTRMKPLTLQIPKPLFPVLNRPSIKRILNQLKNAGFQRVIINTCHLAGLLVDAIKAWDIDLEVVTLIEPFLLGTGGALKNAQPYFYKDSPILLINSDIVTDIDLNKVFQLHNRRDSIATMVVHDRPIFNNVMVDGDHVVGFNYRNLNALAFTGISVLESSLIESVSDRYPVSLIDILSEAIRSGMVVAALRAADMNLDYIWEDIGTTDGYLAAHKALLKNKNTMHTGKYTRLPKDLRREGWCSIGNNVAFGRGVFISKSIIWDGSTIMDNERLEDCVVTPYGRLASSGSLIPSPLQKT